ncbi:MAG: hypothetical protein KBE09_01210 [Candidatus Pacebacteria bacterium]|nr:hypothetical protein [Candidatus Paceibacterota bacterium]
MKLQQITVHLAALALVCLPVAASAAGGTLESPLRFNTIAEFVEGLLRAVVYIALPIISLFIVYAGFKFVTAQGNSDKISAARDNFLYVVIGAILILGAWAIAQLIGGTINELRG